MLQLTPQSRVFLACEPADFRRGIDGLAALCRQQLGEDPMGGGIFVFRTRRGTSLKLLCYDGQGFWLGCNPPPAHGRAKSKVRKSKRCWTNGLLPAKIWWEVATL